MKKKRISDDTADTLLTIIRLSLCHSGLIPYNISIYHQGNGFGKHARRCKHMLIIQKVTCGECVHLKWFVSAFPMA